MYHNDEVIVSNLDKWPYRILYASLLLFTTIVTSVIVAGTDLFKLYHPKLIDISLLLIPIICILLGAMPILFIMMLFGTESMKNYFFNNRTISFTKHVIYSCMIIIIYLIVCVICQVIGTLLLSNEPWESDAPLKFTSNLATFAVGVIFFGIMVCSIALLIDMIKWIKNKYSHAFRTIGGYMPIQ